MRNRARFIAFTLASTVTAINFAINQSSAVAQSIQGGDVTPECLAAIRTACGRVEKGRKLKPTVIAQATSTRKIVVPKLGYSFDVPSWARVINNGDSLEILTQKNFELRQQGQSSCSFQTGSTAGCADISIYIRGNGRAQLEQSHKDFITPCNCDMGGKADAYKGKITINGRTYRKYESINLDGKQNSYLYLTKDNHLVTVVLSIEHYQGNRDALVTVLGSFKE